MALRVYLDACCLNRPLDDQRQGRIRLETEAVEHVLRAVDEGRLAWVSSDAIDYENMKCPDPTRRSLLTALCRRATERVGVSRAVLESARELRAKGLGDVDALHLACACAAGVAVLLTVDDRFLAAASRLVPPVATRVVNPVAFAAEMSL